MVSILERWKFDSEDGIEVIGGITVQNYKQRYEEGKKKWGISVLAHDTDLKNFLDNHQELLKDLK